MKRYEVVTFTGRTWENLNSNEFTSRKKAQSHLDEWNRVDTSNRHKIVEKG